MPWNTIDADAVLAEFTPAERATLENIQGATDNLGSILTNVVAVARGSIRAGGYAVDADGTIPDQLRSDVIALARWKWLISFPQMKAMQTEARKAAAELAQKHLDDCANQKYNIEPVNDAPATTGNWNSERKIVPRAFPVPKPSTQFQGGDTGYANPDGPANS